jgi:hypothetical protein
MSLEDNIREAGQALSEKEAIALWLDLINPEDDAPSLSLWLARLNAQQTTWEQFYRDFKNDLGCRDFRQFVEVFRPFYVFRLVPGTGKLGLPELEFSLEPNLPRSEGWKKVLVRADDALFEALETVIENRALTNTHAIGVNIEQVLYVLTAEGLREDLRARVRTLYALYEKQELEREREEGSDDFLNAKRKCQRALEEFCEDVQQETQAIPALLYCLDAMLAELQSEANNSKKKVGGRTGAFSLGLGDEGKILAVPLDDQAALMALVDGVDGSYTGQASNSKPLPQYLQEHPLVRCSWQDVARRKESQRLPAFVGSLLQTLVEASDVKLDPLIANLLSMALQNATSVTSQGLSHQEIARYRDGVRGIHASATQHRLRTLRPLYTTLLSVYLFFHEAASAGRAPLLLFANEAPAELLRNWAPQVRELLISSGVQSDNQCRDAIDVIHVSNVGPLVQSGSRGRPQRSVLEGVLQEEYDNLSPPVAGPQPLAIFTDAASETSPSAQRPKARFGQVVEAYEFLPLVKAASESGSIVCFSPVKLGVAGRIALDDVKKLQSDYSPSDLVKEPWMGAAVVVPDGFQILPSGFLDMGPVKDDWRVMVQVPEIMVPGAAVASALLCRNQSVEALDNLLKAQPAAWRRANPVRVRYGSPSVVDLTRHAFCGRLNLAIDHPTGDRIREFFLKEDMPFLFFKSVRGRKPMVAAPRTLHRIQTTSGASRFRLVHHYQTEVTLRRLILSAFQLADRTALPSESEMRNLIRFVLGPSLGWYSPDVYLNSFPGRLTESGIEVVNTSPGVYDIQIAYEDAELGELKFSFVIAPQLISQVPER